MEALPLIILIVVLYAVVFLPQQRRAKAHRELLAKLEVGDEVLTSAGMYGVVTEFDGGAVFLALNDDLEVKVTKESITERVVYADIQDD